MKLFWRSKKNNKQQEEKNVALEQRTENEKKNLLQRGADKFSKEFTSTIEALARE